jgi:glyoxylase-like metal-dependent hydrolase (beta-lactamase superfamily II)
MSGVSRITRLGFVNAYLVTEDDGYTLIDTMVPRSAPRILKTAARTGRPIRRIVLTHAHGDHIGSLDALAAALPQAEVIVSARDARLLTRPPDRTLDPGEAQAKLRGGLPGAATKPTRTVLAGERIGSLQVIAAPGHTPGHIALLDTRDRSLICGDAFTTFGGVLETTARVGWRFPLATLATWDRPTELDSARALRALEPSRLFVGHGKHLDDPLDAMDAAIARAAS